DVADRGVAPPGAAEHADAEDLLGTRVVRDLQPRLLLDHTDLLFILVVVFLPWSLRSEPAVHFAFWMISVTRQRLDADIGRVSASRTMSPVPAVFCSSWALSRVVRRIVFWYRRCWRMSSTSTTTVLSILSETTTPVRTLRVPRGLLAVVV